MFTQFNSGQPLKKLYKFVIGYKFLIISIKFKSQSFVLHFIGKLPNKNHNNMNSPFNKAFNKYLPNPENRKKYKRQCLKVKNIL